MIPQNTVLKMIFLREKGFSIPEISQRLSVSKSTVLRRVKNVAILPEYIERWERRKKSSLNLLEKNNEIAEIFARKILEDKKKERSGNYRIDALLG